MGVASPITPEGLVEIARDLYISKLLSGVAITWVLYDWILVFEDEFSSIYQSRLSLAKCLLLYLLPNFDQHYRLNCVAWLYILAFGIYTTLLASNGLLALRLIALYRRQRLVTWFIGGFYFVSYAVTLGLIIHGIPPVGNSMFYSKTIDMCSPVITNDTLKAVFYAPAAFEVFLFGLTAWSVLADSSLIMAAGGLGSVPFLTVFYRDGILCFLVTVALRIWNIWIYLTQHISTYNMGTQQVNDAPFLTLPLSRLMWAANVVLITRVYMNLVWLVKGPKPTETHMGYGTDSNEIQTRGTVNIFRMRRQTQGHPTSFGIVTSEIGSRYPYEVPDFQVLSSTNEDVTAPRKLDLEGA